MLTGVHFLLTYQCTSECDHCFLYCSPNAEGTFTLEQLQTVFREIEKIETMEWVYFEGGEPFLYYPLMLAGMKLAKSLGLKVGIVTNSYWAKSEADALLWLKPIAEIGIEDLSLSDDAFHYGDEPETPAAIAAKAADRLGIPRGSICIEAPKPVEASDDPHRGEPVVGGNVRFRGRAVDKLAAGVPGKAAESYTECPYEDLEKLSRVHVDAYGHVHLCQGLSMGNMWETPLSDLVREYEAEKHPICGPLLAGGPAELARAYGISHNGSYIDACHLCYLTRRTLLDRFPEFLTPKLVYGTE